MPLCFPPAPSRALGRCSKHITPTLSLFPPVHLPTESQGSQLSTLTGQLYFSVMKEEGATECICLYLWADTQRACMGTHTIYQDHGYSYVFACEQVKPPYILKPRLMEPFNLGLTCPSSPLCFLRAKTPHGIHSLTLRSTLISSLDIIFIPIGIKQYHFQQHYF